MNRQEKLILFGAALFCIGLVLLVFVWRQNTYYTHAYTPMVEKAREERKIIESNQKTRSKQESKQPVAPGFRESDIEKQRGQGFSTY